LFSSKNLSQQNGSSETAAESSSEAPKPPSLGHQLTVTGLPDVVDFGDDARDEEILRDGQNVGHEQAEKSTAEGADAPTTPLQKPSEMPNDGTATPDKVAATNSSAGVGDGKKKVRIRI